MLSQLFYNFIDNSLRHGKTVTQVKLYYSRDDSSTRMFYEDNGVGVTNQNKEKIFTEGFTTGDGLGLGLELIKKMVEAYGWTIREIGTEGKGATFQITIPNRS
jgi:signal transduction histidine kinase